MKLLITICARGGSKGIPGKNVKLLNGKPLIAYSIETAKKFSKQISATINLSTDSDHIKESAKKHGLATDYTRPPYLGADNIGKIEVIKDILLYQEKKSNSKFDMILDLDVTSPLRNVSDLLNAYEKIIKDPQALNLFSVSKANRNPYFNMVEKKENGYYALVKENSVLVKARQSAPKVFDLNASFYFYKRKFFDQDFKSAITEKSMIYEMPHTCFDLDEPIDFELMDYFLENNKLDFTL